MKLLLALILWASVLNAAVSKHTNSLGVLQYTENPYSYMYGSVAGGSLLNIEGKKFTSVSFQPSHTYGLFTEQVLFCGDESAAFLKGPIVVTYEKVAHTAVAGIGCHNLLSVDQVMGKK